MPVKPICPSCTDVFEGAAGIPGILFPMDWDTLGESRDGRVYVDNCETCRQFKSRNEAAAYIAERFHVAFKEMDDEPYSPKAYFEITLDEAEAMVRTIRRELDLRLVEEVRIVTLKEEP